MGTKYSPLYACSTANYLQEIKLFINELSKYFTGRECKLIMELLKSSTDDGFIFWPLKLNFETFKT